MTANGRVLFQCAQALGTVLRVGNKEVAWGRILEQDKAHQLQGCRHWHFGDFVVTRQGDVWIGSRDLNGWHFHSHVNGTAGLMIDITRGGKWEGTNAGWCA